MVFLAITVGTCWILAAACNAVMDVLAFKFKKSIFSSFNREFWDPSKSWRNKYKNGYESEGPKFFGSTTFLVWITDGWHLFQFLSNSLIVLSMILMFQSAFPEVKWWMNILLFLVMKTLWGSVFELFFSKLFRSHD